ncbi:helix-turn-helix domain-containing protein [Blautia obeum]|uniref:helix-turn-helix domain-containing protein n=1 Tax=Blautia obeum TaxID=40520 RepID=UPI0015FE0AFA
MRKINRAVKIRIYPNAEQRVQIEKTIGCSRFQTVDKALLLQGFAIVGTAFLI